MKKMILAIIPIFFLAVMATETPACDVGCTPGFWKQPKHADSWPANINYDTAELDDIFPCVDLMNDVGIDPDMDLVDALKAKGGGTSALLRHAVAAYLNGSTWTCFDGNGPEGPAAIAGWFCKALYNELEGYDEELGPYTVERTKDWLENHNEQDCRLPVDDY